MKMNEVVKDNLNKFLLEHHKYDRSIVMDRPYFEFVCEMIALDANLQGFKQAMEGRLV